MSLGAIDFRIGWRGVMFAVDLWCNLADLGDSCLVWRNWQQAISYPQLTLKRKPNLLFAGRVPQTYPSLFDPRRAPVAPQL